GLATIQTDQLHSYEDGINVLGESMLLDFGSPKQIERAMVTAKRLEWLTGINAAGHRHVRSNYFNGAKMATGGVWGWSKEESYMVFHPALSLVLFNGSPETRKMILQLADGFLAHYKPGPNGKMTLHTEVNFKTDEDRPTGMTPWFILWAAYRQSKICEAICRQSNASDAVRECGHARHTRFSQEGDQGPDCRGCQTTADRNRVAIGVAGYW